MNKRTDRIPFWRNPRLRYGSLSTLLLCVALAALVVLNMAFTALERRNGWRVDYSFNAMTTHSETTRQVLAQLPYPVHIYALFSKGSEDAPLMELLDRYAAASDLVTWEQADVALNPGLLTRFSSASGDVVSNDSLIVFCEATGRWKVLSYADFISWSLNLDEGAYEPSGLAYEGKITSALSYVTQDTIPRVIILQGHGELDEATAQPFAELLENNNFHVVYGRLSEFELAPEDLVALLSPVKDLTDSEVEALAAFAEAGGSLLFTCDYADPIARMPNYQALMRAYGFLPKNGMVVASSEEPSTYYDNMRINLIPYMLPGEITADLVGNGYNTLLLPGCRAFESPTDTDATLTVTPLLSSGYSAYLRDLSSGSLSLDPTGEDALGPFALALEAHRMTASGNVSRAFVLGCSALLTSAQIHAMTDAEEFILRTAQYLLNTQPTDLGIMAKAAVRPTLSVRSYGLGSLLLVALPMAVVIAALFILYPRRHR